MKKKKAILITFLRTIILIDSHDLKILMPYLLVHFLSKTYKYYIFLQSSHTGCQSSPSQSCINDENDYSGDTNMTVRIKKDLFDVDRV